MWFLWEGRQNYWRSNACAPNFAPNLAKLCQTNEMLKQGSDDDIMSRSQILKCFSWFKHEQMWVDDNQYPGQSSTRTPVKNVGKSQSGHPESNPLTTSAASLACHMVYVKKKCQTIGKHRTCCCTMTDTASCVQQLLGKSIAVVSQLPYSNNYDFFLIAKTVELHNWQFTTTWTCCWTTSPNRVPEMLQAMGKWNGHAVLPIREE